MAYRTDDSAVKPFPCARHVSVFVLVLGLCPLLPAQSRKPQPHPWVGTWATANLARNNRVNPINAGDTTYRQVLRTSIAGSVVRVEISNEFGTEPLTVGAAQIALSDADRGRPGDIDLGSAHALTFNKRSSVTVPPGAVAISDPSALTVPALTELAVTLFVPGQTLSTITWHDSAHTTSMMAHGNAVSEASLADPALHAEKDTSWFFLKSVDVQAAPGAGAIVAFGDSITNGAGATLDAHTAWPSVLAARLQAEPATRNLAVLNEGIGGNRILHDETGPSALARFDRDALNLPGVRAVILFEAINDIGHATDPVKPYDVVSADDLIRGLSQLIARAHAKDFKVYGATLTPFVGAKYQSAAGEAIREKLNTWIRTTDQLDGVLDFAKATEDPAHPHVYLPADDSGDHLHPADAGYQSMANAIDLKLFAPLLKQQ